MGIFLNTKRTMQSQQQTMEKSKLTWQRLNEQSGIILCMSVQILLTYKYKTIHFSTHLTLSLSQLLYPPCRSICLSLHNRVAATTSEHTITHSTQWLPRKCVVLQLYSSVELNTVIFLCRTNFCTPTFLQVTTLWALRVTVMEVGESGSIINVRRRACPRRGSVLTVYLIMMLQGSKTVGGYQIVVSR